MANRTMVTAVSAVAAEELVLPLAGYDAGAGSDEEDHDGADCRHDDLIQVAGAHGYDLKTF